MKSKIYLLLVAIGIITTNSCKKLEPLNANDKVVTPLGSLPDTDVYAGGYVYATNNIWTVPTYWKNGTIHKLADSSNGAVAASIAVHDTDVVIAVTTEHQDNSAYTAVFYRNGHRFVLADKAFVGMSHCATFSQCGCDFYICGAIMVNGTYKACYWKNWEPAHLLPNTNHQSIATGIAVHGGNVYVSGSALTADRNQYAIYWKNDTSHNLTDTLIRDAQAFDVALVGNDVYVTGYVIAPDLNSNIPTYWVNGVPHTLNKPGGITSIATSGNSFYFGGGADDFGLANYWINGTSYNLTLPVGDYQPRSYGVGVLGSDVYVGGAFDNPANKIVPNYWKNGNFVALPTPNQGIASNITVVAH